MPIDELDDPSASVQYADRKPRRLTEDAIADFDRAAGNRFDPQETAPPEQREGKRQAATRMQRSKRLVTTQERFEFMAWVARRNSRRLKRLGRDLDWLREEALKYGADPTEINNLL